MNLEIEINAEIETIEVLKISLSDNKGLKNENMYFALDDNQLITLVEKQNMKIEGFKSIVFHESIKNVTVPIKLTFNKGKLIAEFVKFFDKHNQKENTTTENSDEFKICSDCGVQAERKDAKFCFHCGINLD